MPVRVIETEYDLTMLTRLLEQQKMPFSVLISQGRKRSWKQNRLNRLWMQEISEQLGDRTPEEARGYCKLTLGVPILRHENEDFREKYDKYIRPLPYETKLAMMMEPLDFPVTRLMRTMQEKAYLDSVQRHFAEQGVVFTNPEDLKYGETR